MSEPAEPRVTPAAQVVRVPVDLVEFEARLLALERRVREQEARDKLMLDVGEAVRRLTKALVPLLEVVGPLVESREALLPAPPAPSSSRPLSPAPPGPAVADSPPAHRPAVEPERLAAAQARLREAATEAAQSPAAEAATVGPEAQSPSGAAATVDLEGHPRSVPLAPAPPTVPPAPAPPPAAQAPAPPPGRHSWLLRALRRMAARDPDSAGRLLVALLPANRLAQIGPVQQLPGPPATVARVVVKGRLRRRIGWEVAQLACDLTTVSELAKLVRLRASPTQLHDAGVRLDPPVVLALVANAIDPLWTLGHYFTLAHVDASAAYLEVRSGRRLAVRNEVSAGSSQTTVRCSADALLPLFAGEPGVAATVEGEPRPLQLVQSWFQDATSAQSGFWA
ncbi:MAG: hypothetical protein ACTHQQ_13640 [Solirubrobacteraceae bacterium]